MYTAQQIDGTFHISPATVNPGKGMRANSKMGILNLIMSNRYAAYLVDIMGHVVVTFEDDAKLVEMQITKCQGLIYIRKVETYKKGV